jgi:hypothetical protein
VGRLSHLSLLSFQKVFFDGRSDFYGPSIGDQYMYLYEGRYDWETILDRNRIDVVLCPVEWPLASLLKRVAEWRLVEDSGAVLLFERSKAHVQGAERAGASSWAETVLSHPVGLMKHPEPAEREEGTFKATMSTARASKGGDSTRMSVPADEAQPRFPETALAGGWRLPQGQTLPEFALESGFLAPNCWNWIPIYVRSRDCGQAGGEGRADDSASLDCSGRGSGRQCGRHYAAPHLKLDSCDRPGGRSGFPHGAGRLARDAGGAGGSGQRFAVFLVFYLLGGMGGAM